MVISMSKITVFETDLQNRIAELLASGMSATDVADACECHLSHVGTVKNSALFARICYDSAMKELFSVGAKVAVDTLIEVARDKKAPKQSRVSASDKLLQHTGYQVGENGKLEKSPANMTQAELNQRLQDLQREASQRANPVKIIEGNTQSDLDKLLE